MAAWTCTSNNNSHFDHGSLISREKIPAIRADAHAPILLLSPPH